MLRKISRWTGRQGPLPELSPAEGYRRWAAEYGREPNVFQRLEAAALERLLPELAGQTVLDLGCGKGRGAALALARGADRAVGADLSLAMLAENQHAASPRLSRAACDGARPSFRDGSFDTVICSLMLGHTPDLAGAIAGIAAVLKPGGCLLASDFHPFATLRGWQRSFHDPTSGESFAIEQHLHLFSDYLTAFERHRIQLDALEEPLWEGFPVAFVLRARKAAGAGQRENIG